MQSRSVGCRSGEIRGKRQGQVKCRLVKCEEANSSVHRKENWRRALGEGFVVYEQDQLNLWSINSFIYEYYT